MGLGLSVMQYDLEFEEEDEDVVYNMKVYRFQVGYCG